MPVIINEIEVLEPPVPPTAAAEPGPAPAVTGDRILRLLRDAGERQRRLEAD